MGHFFQCQNLWTATLNTVKQTRIYSLRLMRQSIEGRWFDKLFLEAIDVSLDRCFGMEIRNLVYVFLRASVSLERKSIPRAPSAFVSGLEKLFGSGATAIEKAIVKELYSKIDLEVSAEDTFPDLIERARASFTIKRSKREVFL